MEAEAIVNIYYRSWSHFSVNGSIHILASIAWPPLLGGARASAIGGEAWAALPSGAEAWAALPSGAGAWAALRGGAWPLCCWMNAFTIVPMSWEDDLQK